MKRKAILFYFWRSFPLEYFSGKFGEIWAKILRTAKFACSYTYGEEQGGNQLFISGGRIFINIIQ